MLFVFDSEVLSPLHYASHQPGEKVSDSDINAWAALEHHFFDVDEAMHVREEVAKMPKPAQRKKKPKPKKKMECPANVKKIRPGALHHIRCLDTMITTMCGFGLIASTPGEDEEPKGLMHEEGIRPI